jgi:hypothetical protein
MDELPARERVEGEAGADLGHALGALRAMTS